ncbi:MAG: sulfurtransferase TusA family protein, partial [Cetobacterium sp.]
MIKVNAIGQTCPIPVIMTKNALKEITEGSIEVSIDNKISK